MGIVAVASLAARKSPKPVSNDDVYLETHQLSGQRGEATRFSLCSSPLNDDVLSLDISKLAQTLPECLVASGIVAATG